MLKIIVIKLIEIYQKTISPDHGVLGKMLFTKPICRFYPTCSDYTKESIKKFGLTQGSIFGLKRLIKCHPGNEGGFDPVL